MRQFLLIALFIPCLAFADGLTNSKDRLVEDNSSSKLSETKMRLNHGEYLRESYLHQLQRTHSSMKYSTHDGLQAASILAKDDNKSTIMFIWNFHEGDIERSIEPDGELRRIDGAPEAQIHITAISPECFEIISPVKLAGRFIKVGSLDEVARRATVAGAYVDSSRQQYVFGQNGEAKFPGKTFQYNVSLDHIELNFDSISVGSSIWKFEWKHGQLLLTKIQDEPPYLPIGKPFLSLTRVEH